jgi:hypothetical protein
MHAVVLLHNLVENAADAHARACPFPGVQYVHRWPGNAQPGAGSGWPVAQRAYPSIIRYQRLFRL